jgi:hypothetical protein
MKDSHNNPDGQGTLLSANAINSGILSRDLASSGFDPGGMNAGRGAPGERHMSMTSGEVIAAAWAYLDLTKGIKPTPGVDPSIGAGGGTTARLQVAVTVTAPIPFHACM